MFSAGLSLVLAAETSGALVLALACLGAPAGPPGRTWRVLAWTAAGVGVALGGLHRIVAPAATLPEPAPLLRCTNATQFAALLLCAWLAGRRAANPWAMRAALVPAGPTVEPA